MGTSDRQARALATVAKHTAVPMTSGASTARLRLGLLGLTFAALSACAPTATEAQSPEPPAPASPAPPAASAATRAPIDPGFAGEWAPTELQQVLEAQLAFNAKVGNLRALSVVLPDDCWERARAELGLEKQAEPASRLSFHAHVPGARLAFGLPNDADPTPAQLQSSVGPPSPEHRLWILAEEAALEQLDVSIYFYADERHPVSARVTLPPLPAVVAQDPHTWGRAVARSLATRPRAPFSIFALPRLSAVWGASAALPWGANSGRSPGGSDFSTWMSLGTGYASIEAALQHDTQSVAQFVNKPSVPLSSLEGPRLRQHDWALMLRQLGRSAPASPLAHAVPADFYLVHAKSGQALFAALDEMDRWGTNALRFVEQSSYRYGLTERYQTQLALGRGPLTRLLGPEVIAEVAWVGSDPFLRRGSDVTLIFRPKQASLLEVGLEAALGEVAGQLGAVTSREFTLAGTRVRHVTSVGGELDRLQAEFEGLVLVSNSAKALERVLLTLQRRVPALAQEPDFQYLLARDAERPADVFLYAGDAFIAKIAAPAARVLDARRGLAWSELRRVGYAALLHSYLGGDRPATQAAVLQSQALQRSHLQHFDGSRIELDGKQPPHSAWGTARHLTPLIDLPPPSKVTEAEAAAYAQFVQHYEGIWSEAMDPIALRLRLQPEQGRLDAHLRVLPVAGLDGYREVSDVAGDSRVDPRVAAEGARVLLALDEKSSLRAQLEGMSHTFLSKRLSLDWVGSYVYLGVLDTPGLAEAARPHVAPRDPASSPPPTSEMAALAQLPLYAAIEVKSTTAARLLLTVLKARFVDDSSDLSLETLPAYCDATIQRLVLRERGEALSLYYALGARSLFLTLGESVLHRLLDREASDQEPRAVAAQPRQTSAQGAGAQLTADLSLARKGGLYYALAWAFEHEAAESESALDRHSEAELVYQVWGKTAQEKLLPGLFYDYWGEEPVTLDGASYTWSASGLRDPARGTHYHPRWPELPVQGADFTRLLDILASLQTRINFEQEAPASLAEQRSLSIELSVETRGD